MTNDILDPALWPPAQQLASSGPARILYDTTASKKALTAAAEAYIQLAQALALPPTLWCVDDGLNAQRATPHLTNVLYWLFAAPKQKSLPAAELLLKAGADPWTQCLRGFPPSAGAPADYRLCLNDASDMAFEVMEHKSAPAILKPLLFAALTLATDQRVDFVKRLLDAYERNTQGSSKTTSGVLGPRDQTAKESAESLSFCEEPLLALARKAGAKELARAEALLADAKERLALKSVTAPNAVDPKIIRKNATKAQKSRLAALALIIQHDPNDDALIEAAFNATPWLAQEPLLACVDLARQGVLLSAALHSLSPAALKALDQAGVNIWLAAAQAYQKDACAWAIAVVAGSPLEFDPSPIARMLLRSAWLSGTSEPKETCLALAREATALIPSEMASQRDRAGALLAALERLALEDAIAPAAPAASGKRASSL